MKGLLLPTRASFVDIVDVLLQTEPDMEPADKRRVLERATVAMAKRARTRKPKKGEAASSQAQGQPAEQDDEEEDDEDEDASALDKVVVPQPLQEIAAREVFRVRRFSTCPPLCAFSDPSIFPHSRPRVVRPVLVAGRGGGSCVCITD